MENNKDITLLADADFYEDALFKPAFLDQDFLLAAECRPLRLQMELLKPEVYLAKAGVHATVIVIGSARIAEPAKAEQELVALKHNHPNDVAAIQIAENKLRYSRYYHEAEKLAFLVTQYRGEGEIDRLHIATGGGPSYMEAANRGAQRAGGPSIALSVSLPHERGPNRYITPELTFKFHYFAMRKMHFLIRAKAMVVFPGGFGTLDELIEALTLMQTGKINPFPILIFARDFWEKLINFDWLVETGVIASADLKLFQYVETAEEAWQGIVDFYKL
ncbi:MAG: hypothetical protein K0R48_1319 [Gammaproteobacteria bacterium]|jgi:uncharacterized protein (TIGR00730 family)|nr:hypothetical protein [Gammaproteobacteria bacterium]